MRRGENAEEGRNMSYFAAMADFVQTEEVTDSNKQAKNNKGPNSKKKNWPNNGPIVREQKQPLYRS